jgi:hypothetical protein
MVLLKNRVFHLLTGIARAVMDKHPVLGLFQAAKVYHSKKVRKRNKST